MRSLPVPSIIDLMSGLLRKTIPYCDLPGSGCWDEPMRKVPLYARPWRNRVCCKLCETFAITPTRPATDATFPNWFASTLPEKNSELKWTQRFNVVLIFILLKCAHGSLLLTARGG
jgi:hypothetical protein